MSTYDNACTPIRQFGWVIMPKRRGRELIRGRFVPRLDFDRRLNLEFHDRGLGITMDLKNSSPT
jgi:hypothetical protein